MIMAALDCIDFAPRLCPKGKPYNYQIHPVLRRMYARGSRSSSPIQDISWQSASFKHNQLSYFLRNDSYPTMGLNMDNIHSPTVPSGPASSAHRAASPSQEEAPLLDLINDKDRVESELRALISVLESVLPPRILSFLHLYLHEGLIQSM